jgi:hypothetical protein
MKMTELTNLFVNNQGDYAAFDPVAPFFCMSFAFKASSFAPARTAAAFFATAFFAAAFPHKMPKLIYNN